MKKLLLVLALLFTISESKAQTITTIIGNGTAGAGGDGGPASAAKLYMPSDVCLDHSGNLYIADYGNHRIRKVNTMGIISTVAGIGTPGFSGDGGPATAAQLHQPWCVFVDRHDNIFIVDSKNYCVRKVDPSGIITRVAGYGVSGDSGDGGPASSAAMNPVGVTADSIGNLYIADGANNRIRKVDTSGIITRYAGYGTAGHSGDGGPASAAYLDQPDDIWIDKNGNLFIVEYPGYARMITPSGIITTIAGSGLGGVDGGPATNADIGNPEAISTDNSGNIYITEHIAIRKINTAGIISTYAGNYAYGYTGDGGPASAATIDDVQGTCSDDSGNLYIACYTNNCIRFVRHSTATTAIKSGESEAASNIEVYPNPTTGRISIKVPQHVVNNDLSITDVTGKIVTKRKIDAAKMNIDLSYLPPGSYFLNIMIDSKLVSKKIVIH